MAQERDPYISQLEAAEAETLAELEKIRSQLDAVVSAAKKTHERDATKT